MARSIPRILFQVETKPLSLCYCGHNHSAVAHLLSLSQSLRKLALVLGWPLFAVLIGCSSSSIGRDGPVLVSPALPITPSTYAYPLKISKNRRYLVDQNNKPFRIQGDSAQSLIANLTLPEAVLYFSDRQAKGFNTININLLEHKFAIHAPANRNGDQPFASPGDFSKPNESYFAFADSIIDLAASKGMLVSLAPMYLGYRGGDEGWWSALTSSVNTQDVCYKFGLFIGNRYKNRRNIFWVIGGDYTPPSGSEGEMRLHKFMEGIKAAGASQPWGGDWEPNSNSTDETAFATDMDLNTVYSYALPGKPDAIYKQARSAYAYEPNHPAYLKETVYENEHGTEGTPASVRGYEYAAILGGCTAGAFFGNRDIWEFATRDWWSDYNFGHAPWQNALNSAGSYDMVRIGILLDAVPWFDLVPSGAPGTKSSVVKGNSDYASPDHLIAASTQDRRTLLAYIPPSAGGPATFTIDLAILGGPPNAHWFDPASGKYIEISGSPLAPRGLMNFTTPGKNAGGATDWVLLLQVPSDHP